MAHVAQMLTQELIYKSSSTFRFKHILLSAHKLILLIYVDNNSLCISPTEELHLSDCYQSVRSPPPVLHDHDGDGCCMLLLHQQEWYSTPPTLMYA